jgi:hypothetical protein
VIFLSDLAMVGNNQRILIVAWSVFLGAGEVLRVQ